MFLVDEQNEQIEQIDGRYTIQSFQRQLRTKKQLYLDDIFTWHEKTRQRSWVLQQPEQKQLWDIRLWITQQRQQIERLLLKKPWEINICQRHLISFDLDERHTISHCLRLIMKTRLLIQRHLKHIWFRQSKYCLFDDDELDDVREIEVDDDDELDEWYIVLD